MAFIRKGKLLQQIYRGIRLSIYSTAAKGFLLSEDYANEGYYTKMDQKCETDFKKRIETKLNHEKHERHEKRIFRAFRVFRG